MTTKEEALKTAKAKQQAQSGPKTAPKASTDSTGIAPVENMLDRSNASLMRDLKISITDTLETRKQLIENFSDAIEPLLDGSVNQAILEQTFAKRYIGEDKEPDTFLGEINSILAPANFSHSTAEQIEGRVD